MSEKHRRFRRIEADTGPEHDITRSTSAAHHKSCRSDFERAYVRNFGRQG